MKPALLTRSTLALALLTGAPIAADQPPPWISLFDGKSLEGCVQHGGKAEYRVEDGAIVGKTVAGEPNSFLCTRATYGDFELELEFQVDPRLNSGVQIRSEVREKDDRVFGYQVEIDPSDRAWSAGIYDEARRGWLNDLKENEPARKAFRQGEWNAYRIVCVGDRLRTWINGVPAADLVDSLTLEGLIALQVHGFRGDSPAEVRWRNIRLRDLGRHVWKPLWNGQDLEGWTPEGGGEWSIDDGVLVGRGQVSQPSHGHLFSAREYSDFTARIEYLAVSGNSGLYFRTEKRDGNVGIAGFQAEIDATKDAGGLYETNGRGWVAQPDPKLVEKCFRPNEWNVMTVSAHGARQVVHVNGTRTADVTLEELRLSGYFAIQTHGGQDMEVRVKRLEILVPEGSER